MLEAWIAMGLSNFDFVMFCFAVFMMLINRLVTNRISVFEIIYRWLAFFCLGLSGIYTFILHAFYPEVAANMIGWPNSPFQYEVAIADLGFGILGLLSFNASYAFRLAAIIGNTIWLWGDAIGHIYQMFVYQNFAIGNAGSWFWLDVFLPLILIICIVKLKPASVRL